MILNYQLRAAGIYSHELIPPRGFHLLNLIQYAHNILWGY